MTDSDYVKCQSIGNLKVIATSDFDKQVKGQAAYTPNLLSPLNKTFIGKCCVYDMTRLLDTTCITVRRSLDTPEDCAALVRDLDSIYDYSLIHLSEIASDHPSFIKRTRVKYYIYSPIAVEGYTFGKIPVFTTILGDKFSDVMYECTFSVVFNDLGQFVRFQDSNHDRNIHVYNQPHNVFNDFTREKDTPVYTHFDKQAWERPPQTAVPPTYQPFFPQPAQPSVFNQQPAQPSAFNQQPAQPSMFNQQPSMFNQQPAQPSAFNQQPSVFNQQPSAFNQQPAQPSMFNQQKPSLFNQQPAQPSMFNQQPAQPSIFQSFGQQQKPSNNTGFVFQDPFAKK